MKLGDLVLTPEPATRTILFGRISGPYRFLEDPIGGDLHHSRGIAWFARVSRDELSYGARNSLGSLLTLTRPSYDAELLRVADAHATDEPPATTGAARGPSPRTRGCDPEGHDLQRRGGAAASGSWRLSNVPATADAPARLTCNGSSSRFPTSSAASCGRLMRRASCIVSMIRSFPGGQFAVPAGRKRNVQSQSCRGAPDSQIQPSHLVLDGQQRLTSLYQALFGVGQSRFFLDIGSLISGAEVNDAVRVSSAERAAALETLEAQANALMMPISACELGRSSIGETMSSDAPRRRSADHVRSALRTSQQAYVDPLVRYAFPVTVLPE